MTLKNYLEIAQDHDAGVFLAVIIAVVLTWVIVNKMP